MYVTTIVGTIEDGGGGQGVMTLRDFTVTGSFA
jgi:hypothetical protein